MLAVPAALLLLLVCRLGAASAAPSAWDGSQCDRTRSRDVRAAVQQILLPGWPPVPEVALATACPLATPDRYREQEAAKEELTEGRWRCRQCGKRFLGEAFLDRHMAHRHPQLEHTQPNATCLADWHAVLHASHLAAHLRGEQGWAADPLPCRPAATAALKEACLQLAEQCRPEATDGSSSAAREGAAALCRMHGLLVSHLCQAHVCDKRRKRTHLMAVAQAWRRWEGGWSGIAVTTAAAAALAFWLLLWLVRSAGGAKSATYRRLAVVRRRLAAAAEAPAALPTVVRQMWGKSHVH